MKKFWLCLLCLLPMQVFAVLPEINFVSSNLTFAEGNSATVSVELSEPTLLGVTVLVIMDSNNSTVNTMDIDLPMGPVPERFVVHVSPGESKGSITFNILEDSEIEFDETLILKMEGALNAIVGSRDTLNIKIIDKPSGATLLPKVNFTSNSTQISEGYIVEVTATLTSPSDSPVVVPISVCGTSEYPSDHDLLANEIVFYPGSTQATLSITIYLDQAIEGNEDLIIKMLAPVTNAELGSQIEHVITIDDVAPQPPFLKNLLTYKGSH